MRIPTPFRRPAERSDRSVPAPDDGREATPRIEERIEIVRESFDDRESARRRVAELERLGFSVTTRVAMDEPASGAYAALVLGEKRREVPVDPVRERMARRRAREEERKQSRRLARGMTVFLLLVLGLFCAIFGPSVCVTCRVVTRGL